MAVRQVRSSVVDGLVFKKLVKEEDPNIPGAKGVYMAATRVSLTPAATSVGGAEQTFTPAELADLDVNDIVTVWLISGAQTANVLIANVRVSAAGTLAITFMATSGTPTPVAGTYGVLAMRVG